MTAVTLSDRFEQHLFSFRVRLEGFVPFERQYRYRCTLRQFGVELDATVNDFPWCNSHTAF